MVSFKEAYKIANDFFLENDYAGVNEARESTDNWLFTGKCKRTCYGTMDACIPKNGDTPYVFRKSDDENFEMWENAKVVSVS